MRKTRQRTRAQALVEFALAAVLIFLLLSAAIDLGLIFFRHQGLYNASLEGAQYGSRSTITLSGAQLSAKYPSEVDRQRVGCLVRNPVPAAGQYICINEDEVRKRIVNEAGASGGLTMVNLKDLDGNGIADDADPSFNLKNFIEIKAIASESDPNQACPSIANPPPGSATCYIYVKVNSDYKMVFMLAPAFGDKVNVGAYTIMPVRAGQFQPGTPVGTISLASVTPSRTPTASNTASATSTATSTLAPGAPSSTPGAGTPSATSGAATATATSAPGGGQTPATATSTRTPTKTNTAGPSPTPTRTKTPGPTRTPTRTNTAGPSPTRTRTNTPKPTNTPGPTKTPTKKPTSAPPTRTETSQGT